MRRRMAPRLAQGQAAVYTVAAQLLLRGINPAFPAVDAGADIISDWGTRIQVKCAYKRSNIWGGSYKFCLDAGQTLYTASKGYKKGKVTRYRMFSHECDFFVMWGINDNRFWIVPSVVCDGRSGVVMVGPETPWLRLDQAAIIADHKAGMTLRALAAKHEICQKTVLRTVHGAIKRTDVDTEFNKALLGYENRWDLLLAEEKILSQGEADVVTPATAEEAII